MNSYRSPPKSCSNISFFPYARTFFIPNTKHFPTSLLFQTLDVFEFAVKCQNPFHDEWSDDYELCQSRIINLRVYGWGEFAQAFVKFLVDEKNVTSKKIRRICKNCLQQYLKKRKFTRHLPQKLFTNKTEMKVSQNFAEMHWKNTKNWNARKSTVTAHIGIFQWTIDTFTGSTYTTSHCHYASVM